MKVYTEVNLRDFNFWSGGKDWADEFTAAQLDEIEMQLESLYPDGMSDTEINDLFWFDHEWLMDMLGIKTEEDLNDWWFTLSFAERCEYAGLDVDDYMPDEDDERLKENDADDIALDDCTDDADKWWTMLDKEEMQECYDENN